MPIVFDRDDVVARFGDDDELVTEILNVYLADTPPQIAVLKEATTGRDSELLLRVSHTIKGSSSNVGAREIQIVAEQIELAAKSGERHKIAALIDELDIAFQMFMAEVGQSL